MNGKLGHPSDLFGQLRAIVGANGAQRDARSIVVVSGSSSAEDAVSNSDKSIGSDVRGVVDDWFGCQHGSHASIYALVKIGEVSLPQEPVYHELLEQPARP